MCTDPTRDPVQIIRWFILRWQVEVTFQEARAHLGVETQRQWSDRAVARTTPCLFGLFSIVTLLAAQLNQRTRTAVLIDSWYFCGCARNRTTADLARDRFVYIPAPAQNAETLTGPSAMLGLRTLSRRLIGQSRA